ncbi:MAG: hypothetical protein O9333_05455, partial [Beijerinckiaceae bacterium]|nr:hypothetical protein [Beijerinckiaceae bacterium]
MKTLSIIALILSGLCILGPARAQDAPKPDAKRLEEVTKAMWPKTPEGWEKRVSYDETQAVCSQFRNDLPQAEFDKVSTKNPMQRKKGGRA